MMSPVTTGHLAVFAAALVALYAAHSVADHWVQTDYQAATKGRPGWVGRRACAAHVATYTAVSAIALAAMAWRCHADLSIPRTAIALAVSAVSHYVADRRTPLRWIAEHVGGGLFWTLGQPRPGHDDNPSLGTGAYALDQSWHLAWLLVAALVIA